MTKLEVLLVIFLYVLICDVYSLDRIIKDDLLCGINGNEIQDRLHYNDEQNLYRFHSNGNSMVIQVYSSYHLIINIFDDNYDIIKSFSDTNYDDMEYLYGYGGPLYWEIIKPELNEGIL